MKNLSRRMKRMLAILLVETIVAVNVISSYASDADGVMTFSEEEVSEMAENASSTSEGGSSDSEPAAEESSYEEPAYEEPVEETPQEEEPQTEEQQETPAEQEKSGTDDPVAEEPSLTNEDAASEETVEETPEEQQPEEAAEEASECTCEKSCGTSEYDAECPVCCAVTDLEEGEREAFLKDHCSKYEEAAEEEKDDITEPEIINKESNIIITGTSVADGAAIEGASDFTIEVSGEVTLSDKAPAIEGYEFNGRIYLKESGSEISAVKKETVENKETEGDVVVKIIKETTVSVYDVEAADWKVLEADTVVVFEYTALEDEEDADENSVQFYAACVDEDGNAIEGYEKQRLTVADALDLTKAPITIEGYEYVEATVDGAVVLSVEKSVAEDAEDEDSTVYSYTTSDGSVEVSEDTTVALTYQAVGEVKEVVLSWSYVDENGNAIEGVEGEPEFEDTLVLDDAEKAPVAVEGYEYVEASIDGTVITSITKETEQTEEADAEPVVTYSYTTTSGESVAIEEDTEITLSYEETGIAVKVDATVVDEFGDEIDEKYTNMELPEFTDGVLVLDDVENPPVAKVQVRKSLFKVVKYTYVQATIDGKIVTGLKREATKETADLAEKEQEFIYSYSTDGTTWTKLTEDTTVIFEYTDGKKTVYTYEDAYVSVTATLQHANAIPDDAEFVVTAVTPSTGGYNYDAYMDALNANAGEISNSSDDQKTAYDETNTLLYDIAFLAAPVDEEGNTVEGELVEYQPAEGMVNISISFKQSQLEDDLAAKDEKDITVVHMPLSDSVKESVSTTADATGISASDINVEVVSDSTSVAGEKTEFVLSDFSVVAVTAEGKQLKAGTSRDYRSILGDAVYYGVTANVLATGGHMDSNFAIGIYQGTPGNYTFGNYTGNNNPGNMIMAKFDETVGSPFHIEVKDNSKTYIIITTEEAKNKGLKIDSTIDKCTVIFDTNHTEEELLAKVSSMVAGTQSIAMMNEPDANAFADFCEEIGNSGFYELDISSYPAGTYYFNFKEGEYNTYAGGSDRLHIKKNDDQVIVFNIPDQYVGVYKYKLNDLKSTDTGDQSMDSYAKTIVFNAPYATAGKTASSLAGVLLFPNADYFNENVGTGWLVANKVSNGAEWHSVWQEMPEIDVPTSLNVEVSKNVNGEPATGNEFTFTLEEWIDNAWEVVEEVQNNGSKVLFKALDFTDASAIGEHYYRVSEKAGTGDYEYDTTRYIVKAVVSASQTKAFGQDITTYAVTSVNYYKATGEGTEGTAVDSAVFNNIKNGSISVTKAVTGKTNATEKFYFVVKDANGNAVEKNGVTVFEISAGKTVTLEGIPFGTYTVQETDASGNAVDYDAAKFPYTVAYSSENVVVNAENNGAVTITNTYKPSKVTISGEKTWNDADNQDGVRPESITICLLADGTEVASKTVTVADNWKWSFTDLDEYKDGKKIKYTIAEVAVEGYTTAITGDAVKGYVVKNSHTPETTSISITKEWDDNGDQDGKRPTTIKVKLYKKVGDGEKTFVKEADVTASAGWTYTFTGLPKYANNGNEIKYTVEEVSVSGYEEPSITGSMEDGFTITNKHTPETTSISIKKAWNDADNQDGKRPSSITVKLYKKVGDGEKKVVKKADVTASAGWTYTFTDLPKYADNGNEIEYTVEEGSVSGYTTSSITRDGESGFVITNTHVPETTDISVTKVWEDNDDQDGVRPDSIDVRLYYTDGDKEVDVETVTLNADNNWTYKWTNLNKYMGGTLVKYAVSEETDKETAKNYTSVKVEQTSNEKQISFVITNGHTPGETSRTVKKVWDDADNQDGVRPTSVEVQLYADDKAYGDPVTLNESNSWTYSWDNLALKAGGKTIKYEVVEKAIVDEAGNSIYTPKYTYDEKACEFAITNTHAPATVYVSGEKTWNDENNQDGIRPESITVKVLADIGENGSDIEVASKEVSPDSEGKWSWTFDNLPKYKNGKQIQYRISEKAVGGYTFEADYSNGKFNLINTHTPETTEVSGEKTWNDADNQDGIRPASITVKLYANGVDTGKTATASADTGWKYSFDKLDKYADGRKITYTVQEAEVTGYEASYSTSGLDVTNTHTPEKTSITIEKKWQDSNNQDGKRQGSITVHLYNGKQKVASAEVRPATDGTWKYTFTDLDKYENGKEIVYTVTEDKVDGYTTKIDGLTITNSHTPEITEIKGSKVWSDGNNQDGKRPNFVTVRLLADGIDTGKSVEVSEKTNWTFSFTDLPKYADGTEINYTVTEDSVSNYTTTISDDVKTAITITNSYTPGKTGVSGNKTWDDADNQDGIRPSSIVIKLYADGQYTDKSVEATAENNWSWSFTDLPEYQNGQKITYTISEETVTGYTPSINGYNVTNTHTPEKISVSGSKTWDDADNQDGKRPVSITITLLANKEPVETKEVTAADNWSWSFSDLPKYKDGKEIGYSVVETLSTEAAAAYTIEYQEGSFNVINKHTPEKVNISGSKTWNDADNQDGVRPSSITINLLADGKKIDSKTVSSADDWKWTFENLDKYADGELIHYSITEEAVDNYSTSIEQAGDYAYIVTNSYTPGKTSKTVVKTWDDGNNQDGIRPTEIKVVLLADGKTADVPNPEVTLNASNNWTYRWTDLALKAKGSTIKYTVQEISEIEGYVTSYQDQNQTATITNTHTPDEVYVEGAKTWNDGDNQDGIRPTEIKINLLADGQLKESKVVTAADNWTWKFEHLPKNKVVNGKSEKIRYSITEDTVTGYESAADYSDKKFNLINTHTPDTTSISGLKKWDDNNNQDGKRPDSITVTLYADGVATNQTATVTADDNWQFSFTDLDKCANGKEIEYTVVETAVEGYTTTITGSMEKGYEITNSHEPAKISVSGEKVWDDADNQDGKRPNSIRVTLYAEGVATDQTAEVTASADGKWSFTFENLDKFINGKEVTYTVKEEVVSGYAVSITGNMADGYTITNTHKPETTSISGTKTWNDADNQDGKRPGSITVNLLANGKVKESKTVTAATNWTYSFEDLDVYENGNMITYTIQEASLEEYGYTATYDGMNITNTYNPEEVNVNGVKTWTDADNQDGIRPTSITVRLYADGEDTGKSVEVSASDDWKYSFEHLDKFKAGEEIVYTVKEDAVEGYTTTISGYNIENTHTPETIEVSGTKTWTDADNQDGKRPSSITIRLLADGTEIQNKVVTANDNWSWSFTDLAKYKNVNGKGVEIVYTITEDAVDGYTTEVAGYNVTNTHTPALIDIGGTKTWNDADDQDGKRPEKIIVYLYADDKLIETKDVTDALGWTYSFTDLPKYKNVDGKGVEIQYTIREALVEGYSTSYDGYNITNSYTPEETSRTVTKHWDDGDNQDGLRPSSITVQLLANGKAYGDPIVLKETDNWTYTWTKLPVKYNKKDITYTVQEITAVEGYETTYSDDTFIITNTHKPAEVYVEGVKTWEDGDNQDGLRPDSITVVLLADGVEYTRMDVTPAADGTWSWKFDNLPKFADSKQIQYSIEEIVVEGYESKADYADGKFNLVNTHKPETVELSGSKTWNDANDQDGVRPSSITIRLLADGVEVDSRTVTAADNWSWTFKDLPKNKNVDGTVSAIGYTITEDAVDGYTASYTNDGTGLINSYTPEKTGRNVVKIWDDGNNADQIRPAYIEVQLYADGEAYGDAVVLNDANGWSHAWTDLQAKKGGQYIVYTVQEITNVSGYTTTVTESGTTFTIVNYHPVTPPPTPTPPTTPPSTPPDVTPTPTTPSITPPPEVPTPTPDDNEVLGARRGGAVLGARRGLDQAVLGKRRRPTTGDSAALIIWMITLFGAMGAATVSVIGLRKKEEEK